MKIKVRTDGFEGYKVRALARAKKIDRKERIEPEISITFEDPIAMARILTVQRLRLLEQVRTKGASISDLAKTLKRDTSAVTKDVRKLESVKMVKVQDRVNPGHGKVKFVVAAAKEYQLTTVL